MNKERTPKYTRSTDLNLLVDQLSRGNTEAFSQIYQRYYNNLLRYGLQIAVRKDVVEDVIQDFFIWLAENHKKAKSITNFEVYLFQSIKRNLRSKANIELRSKDSLERFLQKMEPIKETAESSADQSIIQEETEAERQQLIQRELKNLPGHQREILYLRYYEGLSYQEISEILSISNQVARNFASRAIKTLRQRSKNLEF